MRPWLLPNLRVMARMCPLLCALGTVLLLGACASLPQSAKESGGASSSAAQTQGYILLYKFVQDERRLDQIFLIQDAGEKVEKLVTAIAETSNKAYDQLPELARLAPSVNLESSSGIPEVEAKTREAIAATLATELLETEGEKFERVLLLTQTEGLTYGSHLCEVLVQQETNPKRKKFLGDLAAEYKKFYAQVVDMLKVR